MRVLWLGIAVWLLVVIGRRIARRRSLTARFGEEAAARIIARQVWQGQTAEMLLEARGRPADVDERVSKKNTRHIFKYHQTGKKTFGLRITLEDGVVVGWDDKR